MTDKPKKPDDWSDERWEEYLEWWRKLPGYATGDDVAHLVVVGTKEKPSGNKEEENDDSDGEVADEADLA